MAKHTPRASEATYVPDVESAAAEAAARLRVVLHILEGVTNDDFAACDGYEVSVVEDIVRGVITLLGASVAESARLRKHEDAQR